MGWRSADTRSSDRQKMTTMHTERGLLVQYNPPLLGAFVMSWQLMLEVTNGVVVIREGYQRSSRAAPGLTYVIEDLWSPAPQSLRQVYRSVTLVRNPISVGRDITRLADPLISSEVAYV